MAKVHPWSWNIKAKPLILHWCFKISFTSSIITLFTDQHSSHGIKPQTLTLIPLGFFWKIEAILMMELAIPQGVLIGILLVLHRITTFFTNDSKAKLMAHHRTFLMRSPPIPKFNTFIWVKYSFHTLGYLLRPATMVSPNKKVLDFKFNHRTTALQIIFKISQSGWSEKSKSP